MYICTLLYIYIHVYIYTHNIRGQRSVDTLQKDSHIYDSGSST